MSLLLLYCSFLNNNMKKQAKQISPEQSDQLIFNFWTKFKYWRRYMYVQFVNLDKHNRGLSSAKNSESFVLSFVLDET